MWWCACQRSLALATTGLLSISSVSAPFHGFVWLGWSGLGWAGLGLARLGLLGSAGARAPPHTKEEPTAARIYTINAKNRPLRGAF